jgi:hypothetical protein
MVDFREWLNMSGALQAVFQNQRRFIAPSVSLAGLALGASGNGNRTFSAVSIGSANAARRVIVVVGASTGGTQNITAITVGGAACTIAVSQTNPINGEAIIAITNDVFPTGTTADIVLTASSASGYNGIVIGTFSALNLISSTATATASATANGASMGLVVRPNGIAVGVGGAGGVTGVSTGGSFTGGFTEEYFYDGYASSVGVYSIGGALASVAGSTLSISGDIDDAYFPAFAVAAFT